MDDKKKESSKESEQDLDKELKLLIEQSELKTEALKKMMNKLNEQQQNDSAHE